MVRTLALATDRQSGVAGRALIRIAAQRHPAGRAGQWLDGHLVIHGQIPSRRRALWDPGRSPSHAIVGA